jgi:hypothetical protein
MAGLRFREALNSPSRMCNEDLIARRQQRQMERIDSDVNLRKQMNLSFSTVAEK